MDDFISLPNFADFWIALYQLYCSIKFPLEKGITLWFDMKKKKTWQVKMVKCLTWK